MLYDVAEESEDEAKFSAVLPGPRVRYLAPLAVSFALVLSSCTDTDGASSASDAEAPETQSTEASTSTPPTDPPAVTTTARATTTQAPATTTTQAAPTETTNAPTTTAAPTTTSTELEVLATPPTTTIPPVPCPQVGDAGWFQVRQIEGDPDGDSHRDTVVTATQTQSADPGIAETKTYELCIQTARGPVYRTAFESPLADSQDGGTRAIGSLNVGDHGDTVFVTVGFGASTLHIDAYAITSGELVRVRPPDDDVHAAFVVHGGVQHAGGATCIGPDGGGQFDLVIRRASAVAPLPTDYNDVTFERTEASWRRSGDRFVELSSTSDTVRYGDWTDATDWWQLVGCPRIEELLG